MNFFKKCCRKLKITGATVAVIKLHGIIDSSSNSALKRNGLSLHSLKKEIDKAFAAPKLTAIALSINSPGGAPVQAELISNYIRAFANQRQIPVFSFIEDVAASGGYWLACCGDEIYASKSSIVGSIGVISSGFGFSKAIEKLGIERRVLSQGKNKSIYDSFLPTKQSDKELILDVQSDVHNHFKDMVISSRGERISLDNSDQLFNGKFWSGSKSLELGLIDGIGDIYSIMQAKYAGEISFKFFDKEESWIQKKLGLVNILQDACASVVSKVYEKMALSKFGL